MGFREDQESPKGLRGPWGALLSGRGGQEAELSHCEHGAAGLCSQVG